MFDIVGKRFWFFLISGALLLISIISLATQPPKMGVEFTGGSMLTINFEQNVTQEQLNQELANLGYGNAIVQRTGAGEYLIRTIELSGAEKQALEEGLNVRFGNFNESYDLVSPLIATETGRSAAIAVAVASLGILLYLTWAFRRMPHPFRFGTCAVVALLHDVVIVLGVFSVLGALLNWEINLMFITGVLAVIGYSVNNVVVIFDRIRENVSLGVSPRFDVIVNNSLVETMGRSFNTTVTTLFTVVALMLFVGATIQNFVVVLMIGLTVGLFDSLCVAPMLLVVWDKGEWRRFLPGVAQPAGKTAR